jgi:hypothetical protein
MRFAAQDGKRSMPNRRNILCAVLLTAIAVMVAGMGPAAAHANHGAARNVTATKHVVVLHGDHGPPSPAGVWSDQGFEPLAILRHTGEMPVDSTGQAPSECCGSIVCHAAMEPAGTVKALPHWLSEASPRPVLLAVAGHVGSGIERPPRSL